MADMNDAPAPEGPGASPPPYLRFLKILVTALAGTMIIGLITLIALIVIRFPATPQAGLVLPSQITLPEGETPEAVTFGRGWTAVVTARGEILVLDPKSGAVMQRLQIDLAK